MVWVKGDHLTRLKSTLTVFFSSVILLWLPTLFPAPAQASSKRSGRAGRVQTGLDVLEAQKFAPLRGKPVGLITNHTGLDSQGRSTADVLSRAAGVQLIALFSPEHGLAGRTDEKFSSTKDPSTGLPV